METDALSFVAVCMQVKDMVAAHALEWAEMIKWQSAEEQTVREQHVIQQCETLRKLLLMEQQQQTQQLSLLHER